MNDERYEIPGNVIHVRRDDNVKEWEVWLNSEGTADFSGHCIGVGDTRRAALIDAAQTLGAVIGELLERID